MTLILPLRSLEMLMLLLNCVKLVFSFLACCKLRSSPRGKQALVVSFLCGTFWFCAWNVSIRLLYTHVFYTLILLPFQILPIVMNFIRVAFFDRELAEGASCLTYQAWLLMGTLRASTVFLQFLIILRIESSRTSIFILLFTRAVRISHLFNGLISDNWLFCLFCARATGHSVRKLPRGWARACTSRPMIRIPRFWFALAAGVLSNDMLVCWRHLALIVLTFTLIQIIATWAVIYLLQLRRRSFLIALNNRVRLLLISRL